MKHIHELLGYKNIKIIQDENSYSMNTTRIYESNNIYYLFSTDDLDLKINKLAIETIFYQDVIKLLYRKKVRTTNRSYIF